MTLHQSLHNHFKENPNSWIHAGELMLMKWKDSKGKIAIASNISRRLREMESGYMSDAKQTPVKDSLRIARGRGVEAEYRYLPEHLVGKYIPYSERKDKSVMWREKAIEKPKQCVEYNSNGTVSISYQ